MSSDPSQPSAIGRYEVVRILGRGSMGVVYEGRDPSLERVVAIKLLRTDLMPDPAEAATRFMRETQAAARLSHPNIVQVYDVGVQDGVTYMVMELVRGRELKELLDRGESFSTERAVAIVLDLLDALGYAHEQGVVHRDVKAANVILRDDGSVKLTDFGIARITDLSDVTLQGTILGTPRFMAPEQLRGESVGPPADIFAVGVLLYRLLANQWPFDGAVFEIARQIMSQDPKPPSEVHLGAPSHLDRVVLRALAKKTSERYASARDFASDLRSPLPVLPTSSESARPVAAPSPAREGAGALPLPPRSGAGLWGRIREWALGQPPSADPGKDAASAHSTLPPTLFPERDATAAADRTIIELPSNPPPAAPGPLTQLSSADGTMQLRPLEPIAAAPAMPGVQLVVTASNDARIIGRAFQVTSPNFEVGRDAEGLALADPLWSRRHAVIRFAGSGFVIGDLGSSNGTYVNGRRVTDQKGEPLLFGASIRIGATVLTFTHAQDTSLPDLTGRMLAGRYALERCLRTSPKGAVYEARVSNFGASVAIKVLAAELVSYPGYREQFEREATIAKRLHHPHICPVLDFGHAEVVAMGRAIQTPFLCYALMAGGNLADRLADKTPPERDRMLGWVRDVAAALGHAHRNGVVHGDLKPTAICFDADLNAYVTDFAVAGMNAEGRPLLGAPAFMAPEQWLGATPTPRTDQFALAVLAYSLVAGARPFEGQEDPQIRERNFRRGPYPAHEEARQNGRDALPRAVSDVLRRALAISEGDRFESVEQFAQAFESALRGRDRSSASPLVFISYRHEPSAGWAVLLARELKEKHGIEAFVDTQRLDGAIQFPAKLARAIEDCEVFVCLLASSTLESRWVCEEIKLAHVHRRPMIPVFQESFAPGSKESLDPAIETLLQYDGVHLLDQRNIHVDHTIADLARLVMKTAAIEASGAARQE